MKCGKYWKGITAASVRSLFWAMCGIWSTIGCALEEALPKHAQTWKKSRLHTKGEPLTDVMRCSFLLNSLGPEYKETKAAIYATGQTLKWGELVQKLHMGKAVEVGSTRSERRRRHGDEAYAASSPQQQQPDVRKKLPSKPCFKCGGRHWTQDCLLSRRRRGGEQAISRPRQRASSQAQNQRVRGVSPSRGFQLLLLGLTRLPMGRTYVKVAMGIRRARVTKSWINRRKIFTSNNVSRSYTLFP